MARPKFIIDYNQVKVLAELFCTQEEIATILGCDVRTLQKDEEFIRIYKRGLEEAKTSLRRMQYLSAKKGNVTMQIWLGKQYLGQRDNKDINVNDLRPITIVNDLAEEEEK